MKASQNLLPDINTYSFQCFQLDALNFKDSSICLFPDFNTITFNCFCFYNKNFKGFSICLLPVENVFGFRSLLIPRSSQFWRLYYFTGSKFWWFHFWMFVIFYASSYGSFSNLFASKFQYLHFKLLSFLWWKFQRFFNLFASSF